MFSFGSTRLARGVFALFVVSCLSMVLLFTGCKTDDSDPSDDITLDTRLIGNWISSFNEKYEITAGKLVFDGGYTPPWSGTVVHAAKFSDNDGVIIIEYETGKGQIWYDWSDYPNAVEITRPGNFYGVYYRSLTADSVVLSNTSSQVDNGPSETTTKAAAINRFTLDNRPDWIDEGYMTKFDRTSGE